jgi:[ribosomal protein S18]-alanine N-acetyltransferase
MASLMALSVARLANEEEAQSCAHLMAESEPWLTLGRTYEASLAVIQDPSREVYWSLGWLHPDDLHPS